MIRAVLIAALVIGPAAASDHESHVRIQAQKDARPPLDIFKQLQTEMALRLAVAGKLPPAMNEQYQNLLKQIAAGDNLDDIVKRLAPELGMSPATLSELIKSQSRLHSAQATSESPFAPENDRLQDLRHRLNLDQLPSSWQKSDAIQGFVRDLARANESPLVGPISIDQVESALNRIETFLKNANSWLPNSVGALPKFDLRGPNFANGVNFSAPSWELNPMIAQWLLPALAAITIGFAGWFLWSIQRKARPRAAKKRSEAIALIDPDTVTTRESLIRAFEHLALVIFGIEANHWHHHIIANRLAVSGAYHADAEFLARAYEQARYAPDTTNFDWPACRDALKRLAGIRK